MIQCFRQQQSPLLFAIKTQRIHPILTFSFLSLCLPFVDSTYIIIGALRHNGTREGPCDVELRELRELEEV